MTIFHFCKQFYAFVLHICRLLATDEEPTLLKRCQDLGFGTQDWGFGVYDTGFDVWNWGFVVWDWGYSVLMKLDLLCR